MKTFQKKTATALLALVLCVTMAVGPALAAAEEEDYSPEAMLVDAVFLRPMGLVATCFGSAVFILTLPFTIVSGNTSGVGEKLVGDPLRYTFQRPLGEID
jgi:hypothetical protein